VCCLTDVAIFLFTTIEDNILLEFDVCIIGAGPAGIAAAIRAWDFGQQVCIIEKGPLGGASVHNGALSSKTLWELSRDYINAGRQDRGYIAENVEIDFPHVVNCVHRAINEKVSQISSQFAALSQPRPGCPNCISLVRGNARFLDSKTLCVDGNESSRALKISAKNFIIATGSRPRTLDEIIVDGSFIMTSDHMMDLMSFPRSMVILGAGVAGCEFATIFANFGQTKVYLIDRADRILPFEDEDISRICSTNLEAKGVTIHHRAKLLSMQVVDDQVEYTIEHHTGGKETIQVERALISVGRVPNVFGLGLDKAGVLVDEQGRITSDNTQTSVPHIYAIGDVSADKALVSIGEIQGRYAIERIYANADSVLSYENLSTIMFLDPEVAAIGLNEQQAQDNRIPYRVSVYGYSLVNRAIAMRATDGFVKLLVTNDEDMRILGMRVLGVHASTSIEAVSLMMKHDRSVCDLAELLHPHPAVTEGVQECARMLLGTSIYKPQVFQSDLRLSQVTYSD